MNFSLQDKPCSNQMADSWLPTTVISHFYSAVYLKALQRHVGKVAVIVDRASPHRAKLVRQLLRENKNIKIMYLPKGSPFLNPVEECWHQGKRILLVSEYYRTVADLQNAISEYFRTVRFRLDLLTYVYRKPQLFCTNL